MQCPKCSGNLVIGEEYKDADGFEGTEYRCPDCNERFVDVKVPHSYLKKHRRT